MYWKVAEPKEEGREVGRREGGRVEEREGGQREKDSGVSGSECGRIVCVPNTNGERVVSCTYMHILTEILSTSCPSQCPQH